VEKSICFEKKMPLILVINIKITINKKQKSKLEKKLS